MNLPRVIAVSLALLSVASPVVGQDRSTKSATEGPDLSFGDADDWRLREMELMARIRGLELELVQERNLRVEREQEWMEFTKLLALLPEEKRPQVPGFLRNGKQKGEESEPTSTGKPNAEEVEAQKRLARASEIKTILRAYLRAEGVRALDLLEVGLVGDGFIGPIVARQLDENGRFLSTLVADRLRLEKSRSGFTLTMVLEDGYERRTGRIWPFPVEHAPASKDVEANLESSAPSTTAEQAKRTGVLRIPLAGVSPGPWIKALPELFSAEALGRQVNDGQHDALALRFSMNQLLAKPRQGGRWRLISLGGVVGTQWHDLHLAELSLDGKVVRRIFADQGQLSMQGDNLMFALESGAQERAGQRTSFLAGRYTLVLTQVDREAWLRASLPGLK
ncbi:MAG: hypothetical protein GY930_20440 [bacterium]|nr:hypothetical protein [bacterium]